MGQLQGKDINIYVRESGTTGSFLKLVCETSSGIDIATNTTTTVTKCASYTSTSEPTVTLNVDGVVETSPTGSEISFEQLLSYIVNGTLVDVKYESPVSSGTDFYVAGTAYLTALSLTAPAEGLASFTGTITITGTVDITA